MNRPRRTALVTGVAMVLLLSACDLLGWSQPSPSPTGEPLDETGARYALLERLGPLWYCDPDFFPLQFQEEQAAALEHWAEVTADDELYESMLGHLGWDVNLDLTDAEKLTVYREWKVLRAMTLQATGDGAWRFDLLTLDAPGAEAGRHTVGTISDHGSIKVELQEPSSGPICPICLARGTLIDTPAGPLPVEQLRMGDLVWTVDRNGARLAAPVRALGSTAVPASHRVVHLVLADGREVWVSPGHPTADGRRAGQLRAGDVLDGSRVVAATFVPYAGGSTFDLLPAGDTGAYWANGILLESTLMTRSSIRNPVAGVRW